MSFLITCNISEQLEKLLELTSSYTTNLMHQQSLTSAVEAIGESLQPITNSSYWWVQLIWKGGDFATLESQHFLLSESVLLFADFLENRQVWSNQTILCNVHESNCTIKQMLQFQTNSSDLCYLIQCSNILNCHLMLQHCCGNTTANLFRLNIAVSTFMTDIRKKCSTVTLFLVEVAKLRTDWRTLSAIATIICRNKILTAAHKNKFNNAQALFDLLPCNARNHRAAMVDIKSSMDL